MRTLRATSLWVSGGSVLSAAAASACCWLPLLLVVFGVSAGGLSMAFEKVRPFLLVVSPVLLGFGFYLNYFRQARCKEGECSSPNPDVRRVNRVVLWVASAAVLVFAFFPMYSGVLISRSATADTANGESQIILHVDGMTCDGCAVNVRTTLKNIPGVIDAVVSYADKRAVVTLDGEAPPSVSTLVGAIKRIGYEAAETAESPQDGDDAP